MLRGIVWCVCTMFFGVRWCGVVGWVVMCIAYVSACFCGSICGIKGWGVICLYLCCMCLWSFWGE